MRISSAKSIFERKFRQFELDGDWAEVIGSPDTYGSWIVWGAEKNGKTTFALMLANYMSNFAKTLYISAEEGISSHFVGTCQRVGIEPKNPRLYFLEYISVDELRALLTKRRAPGIVFLDNLTIYFDELKNGGFRKLLKDFPNVLFVCIAHEERNEPYTATAKLCKKLSKAIFHVEGLACYVSGRCPGGVIAIDDEKARLYHGNEL